ncbi:putative Transmembrane protein 65 [Leishmania shawi]|uniref:Transmembrane protein 65 n=1 Tax=Leishmania shawi TaxID=5680 RepID=A0AAW3C913_9TRYP
MRRCGRAPTRQVSSCALLLPSWAITHAPTHSRRQVTTTTSAAVGVGVATSIASASSSPNPSTAATTTAAAAAEDAAAVAYAPYSSSTNAPASVIAAPTTSFYMAPSSASLAEMTGRLREALRTLSEVEKAKVEQAMRVTAATAISSQSSSVNLGEGRVALSTAASMHHPSAAVPPGALSATSTEEPTASDSSCPSSSKSGGDVSGAATANAPSMGGRSSTTTSEAVAMPLSTSSSWIRNKKPKFWALVNEAGTDEVEGGDNGEGFATAFTAAGSAVAAPSGTAASRSTSATASAPLTATAPTLTGGAAAPAKELSQLPALAEPLQTASDVATASSPPSRVAASTFLSATVDGRTDGVSSSSLKATGGAVTAHSVRTSTSVSPFRNRYKRDVAHVLSELLSNDPALGPQLLSQLSAESRRLLLIMGAASEYFGVDYEEVAEQVKEADTDRDNSISSKEYDAWVRRMADSTPAKRRHAKEGQAMEGALAPVLSLDCASAQGAAVAVAPLPLSSTASPSSSRDATETNPSVKGAASTSTTAHPPVAVSAPLSRQTADMATDTAKAARACIIGVMQKSASSAAEVPASHDAVADRLAASVAMPSSTSASFENSTAGSSCGRISDVTGGGAVASPFLPTTSAATVTSAARASVKQDPSYIPWSTYLRIVVTAAPPFLAFGMLDNSTLVLAGGAIDNALSGSLGLSQMAAASLGGVVSGVAGIQVHGLAERYTRASPPRLAPEQQRGVSYSRATQAGNMLGMVVGLILGMTPLLFMSGSTQLAEQEERDRNRFRQEAGRSHQRQCKAVEKKEIALRQQLWEEEKATREALLRDKDNLPLLSSVQG